MKIKFTVGKHIPPAVRTAVPIVGLLVTSAILIYATYGRLLVWPEEISGLNLEIGWRSLVDGTSPVSGRPRTTNDLISVPGYLLETVIGDLNVQSFLATLWIRLSALALLTYGLLRSVGVRDWVAFIASVIGVASFTSLASVVYIPKVSGATLAVGLLLLFSRGPQEKSMRAWVAGLLALLVFTWGTVANLTALAAAWSTLIPALVFARVLRGWAWPRLLGMGVLVILCAAAVYLPSFVLVYGQDRVIESYSNLLSSNSWQAPPSDPWLVLAGRGYWAEFESFNGTPYIPWAGKADSLSVRLEIASAFVLIITVLITAIRASRWAGRLGKASLVLLVWDILLFLLISTPRSGLIWRQLDLVSPYVSAFREPWTKFSTIFWVLAFIIGGIAVECALRQKRRGGAWINPVLFLMAASCAVFLLSFIVTVQSSINYWTTEEARQEHNAVFSLHTPTEMNGTLNGLNLVPDISSNGLFRPTCLIVDSEASDASIALNLAEVALRERVFSAWQSIQGEMPLMSVTNCRQMLESFEHDIVAYDPDMRLREGLQSRCARITPIGSGFVFARNCTS